MIFLYIFKSSYDIYNFIKYIFASNKLKYFEFAKVSVREIAKTK